MSLIFDSSDLGVEAEHVLQPTLYARAAATLACAQVVTEFPEGRLSMFDFGSCWGESLAALADVAINRGDGSTVVGSEIDPERRQIATEATKNLVGIEQIVGDGIEHLEANQGAYDIVSALMFGPSHNGTLAERFLPAALKALRVGGLIVINSDLLTIRAVSDKVELLDRVKALRIEHQDPLVANSSKYPPLPLIVARKV